MNITVVEARDLSEAWFLCLGKVLEEGYEYEIQRGSYEGQTRKQLDMAVIHVNYPAARPLIPDVPQGVPPPSTMDYVESYLPYLMAAHRKEGEQYTYEKMVTIPTTPSWRWVTISQSIWKLLRACG